MTVCRKASATNISTNRSEFNVCSEKKYTKRSSNTQLHLVYFFWNRRYLCCDWLKYLQNFHRTGFLADCRAQA